MVNVCKLCNLKTIFPCAILCFLVSDTLPEKRLLFQKCRLDSCDLFKNNLKKKPFYVYVCPCILKNTFISDKVHSPKTFEALANG